MCLLLLLHPLQPKIIDIFLCLLLTLLSSFYVFLPTPIYFLSLFIADHVDDQGAKRTVMVPTADNRTLVHAQSAQDVSILLSLNLAKC